MSPKKRTIAILKYINSIELNRIKYIIGSYDYNMLTIYSLYRDVVKILSPGHHILNNLGYIQIGLLLQENTNYVLQRRHRMLINLISFCYHQKDYDFTFFISEKIIKKNLFAK